MKKHVVIVAPSLDLATNVSGVSAVTNFIIKHNKECEYIHFLQGKSDGERGALNRIMRLLKNYRAWVSSLPFTVYRLSENDKGLPFTVYGLEGNGNDNGNGNGEVVIHYNFPLDAFSVVRDYFFLRAAHKRKLPMVIHIHGGLYLFKEDKPFIIKRFLKEVFSWDCPFIVLSQKEKEQIQRLYGTKNVWVLPNCVEIPDLNDNGNVNVNDTLRYDTLRYDTERSSYDNQDGLPFTVYGLQDENGESLPFTVYGLEILYLGRIEPNKGMDYMLEAMRGLKEKGDSFTLHFAGIEQGKNGYIERFQKLLGDQFIYEGQVSGDKKTALLKKCQVFLLPSFYEGLPMSLLETMSYGMVPVVTDVGSISEYVEDGVNGLLIKTRDSATIVTAIDRLMHDRGSLQNMSVAARQTIITRLKPEKYIEQLNEIYSKTIEKRQSAG